MRWKEISIHTTEEAAEVISDLFIGMGSGGASIEESGTLDKQRDTSFGQLYDHPFNNIPNGEAIVKGYFAEHVVMDPLVEQLKVCLVQLNNNGIEAGPALIELREVDEEDWAAAWKQYFKPIRISNKITIKPTWEEYAAEEDEVVIELDPGMAFGTGTHPTTVLCLRSLEQYMQKHDEVIDVGTGTGVLAIGAAKLGADHVLALDLDPVAISSAEENIGINQLQGQITLQQSDLLEVLQISKTGEITTEKPTRSLGVSIPVKLVVANILAEIIILFVSDVYEVLQHGGYYITSGIIKRKAPDVEKALLEAGFVIAEISYEQDWAVIVARKE